MIAAGGLVFAVPSSSFGMGFPAPYPLSTGYAEVQHAPYFITAPRGNVTVFEGELVRFTVEVRGYPWPTLQWRKNGVVIPGVTGTEYSGFTKVSDSGTYTVIASNSRGSATLVYGTLTVHLSSAPEMRRQPASQEVREGEPVTFMVEAQSTPSPAYQWQKDGIALAGATNPVLKIAAVRPADAGSYDVVISNLRGRVVSEAATLEVRPPATRILAQPAHASATPGSGVSLHVSAAGTNLTYQWRKNGADIADATGASHMIRAVSEADTGFYSVVVTGAGGTVTSDTAILTLSSSGDGRLVNLSARGHVAAGSALTVGLVTRGPGSKSTLIRAIGPGLGNFGMVDFLGDPSVELWPAGAAAPALRNDDWSTPANVAAVAAAASAVGAFPLAPGSKDAALLAELADVAPHAFTARISSAQPGASGVVLAELYDANPTRSSRLAGLSVLGESGIGDRALIPGFSIAGKTAAHVLIRAVGPGLERFGITGALVDPRITVYAPGLESPIARNDNWDAGSDVATASAAVGAFPLATGSKDAAVILSLPPGTYTVVVNSADGAPGLTLVEVYDLGR